MVSTLASLQTSILNALVMDELPRGRDRAETRKSPTAGMLPWSSPSNSGVLSPSVPLPALRTPGSAHLFVRKGDQTAFTQLEYISSRGKKKGKVTEFHQSDLIPRGSSHSQYVCIECGLQPANNLLHPALTPSFHLIA